MNRDRKEVKHFNEPGDAHFLTFSCRHRLPLLSKDRTRHWLLKSLNTARSEHQFDLWAWVIMPEHVHLLIYPRRPVYATDHILWSIKQPVGQLAIAYLRGIHSPLLKRLTVRHGRRTRCSFWQPGPGDDHNIWRVKTIHKVMDYIHMNPVRRGLVEKPTDWLWSSARDWAGLEGVWLKVDRTAPMLHPYGP